MFVTFVAMQEGCPKYTSDSVTDGSFDLILNISRYSRVLRAVKLFGVLGFLGIVLGL